MNAKKFIAVFMVVIMAMVPVAVMAGSTDGADTDTAKGTSVEFKGITVGEAIDFVKSIDLKTSESDGFNVDDAAEYIAMVLFPGLNYEAFTTKEEGKSACMDEFLNVKLNITIAVFSDGVANQNMSQKVAITVETVDMSAKITNIPIDSKVAVFSTMGNQAMFVDGKYLDGLKATGLEYYTSSVVAVSGELKAKIYLETGLDTKVVCDKTVISEGGLNITPLLEKMCPFLATTHYPLVVKDVRAEVDSDITAQINGKDVGFKTNTMAMASVNFGYDYAVSSETDGVIDYVTISVKDCMVKVKESARLTFDGNKYENNAINMDLSTTVKSLFDNRAVPFDKTDDTKNSEFVIDSKYLVVLPYFDISNVIVSYEVEKEGEIVTETANLYDYIMSVYDFKEAKVTASLDASAADKEANSIAGDIYSKPTEQDFVIYIVAAIIILVIVLAAYIILRKKKAKA